MRTNTSKHTDSIVQINLVAYPKVFEGTNNNMFSSIARLSRQVFQSTDATLVFAFGELQILEHLQIQYREKLINLKVQYDIKMLGSTSILQIESPNFPLTVFYYQNSISRWFSPILLYQIDYLITSKTDWETLLLRLSV